MAAKTTIRKIAHSRRRFLLMGLVTAGVAKTSGISDSNFADKLINVSYAGGREDDRSVDLGSAAIHNQGRKKVRRWGGKRNRDRDTNETFTGEITIEKFGGSGVPGDNSPRFDTPPPGTRQRLRRRKARRRKLKRVVESVLDFVMPVAHAAPRPTFDLKDARLYVEIDTNGRWGVAFNAQSDGEHKMYVGTAESTATGVYLDPTGPGCVSADPDLDISVSLVSVNTTSVDFALTAHHADLGLAFAAFGRLPKTQGEDSHPVANWCQPHNGFKRSPFFP